MSIYIWQDIPVDYLCFTAEQANCSISLNKTGSPTSVTLETSTDWSTWSSYTIWNIITLSNLWDKVYFRNTSETTTWFSTSSSDYYTFNVSWNIAWSWDINVLLNKNSTTILSSRCYHKLFYGCWDLTTAPSLPATTLADKCYKNMFERSGLKSTPSLPATTLADSCYYQMFHWCISLTWLPKLHATTLSDLCYYQMFQDCTNIKLSSSQTWIYQTAYRIPSTWTGAEGSSSLYRMFYSTWWTFTGTPNINTTYYTSNTVV